MCVLHLQTEIGRTGASIKMEYKNDIADMAQELKAAQVLSVSSHASSI